ncbi:Gluconolactonase [Candidatus Entotheonellaceae bacterium PAL068K]
MVTMIVLDPSLEQLVTPNAQVQKIATGFVFTEGPVWHSKDQRLIFSDIRGDTMYAWTEAEGHTVFRHPSGEANGNTYDRHGNLLTCEHRNRRLTRTRPDGSIEVVASHYQGKRLNSPNDVVCAPDGSIYFTDPPYGLRQPDGSMVGQELDFCGVYRVAPNGTLTLLVDDFERPNGLVVTADGAHLLIDDTERHLVRMFDLNADGSLSHGRVLAELRYGEVAGRGDGMKLDANGNLYVTGNTDEGIWVFNPAGKHLGFIGVREPPANLAWGGADWQILFVTARTSVYRVPMQVPGQPVVV